MQHFSWIDEYVSSLKIDFTGIIVIFSSFYFFFPDPEPEIVSFLKNRKSTCTESFCRGKNSWQNISNFSNPSEQFVNRNFEESLVLVLCRIGEWSSICRICSNRAPAKMLLVEARTTSSICEFCWFLSTEPFIYSTEPWQSGALLEHYGIPTWRAVKVAHFNAESVVNFGNQNRTGRRPPTGHIPTTPSNLRPRSLPHWAPWIFWKREIKIINNFSRISIWFGIS